MNGPSKSRRRSSRRQPLLRLAAVALITLVVLSFGVSSVSFTTLSVDRTTNIPVVSKSNEANAVHGLDKNATVADNVTSQQALVNVTNNFADSGSQPSLTYTVTLLNNTGKANLDTSGATAGDSVSFSLAPDGGTQTVYVKDTANVSSNTDIKYAVNATGTNLQVNATRVVTVENTS